MTAWSRPAAGSDQGGNQNDRLLAGIVSGQLITREERGGRVLAMVVGRRETVVVGSGADHASALLDAARNAPALAG